MNIWKKNTPLSILLFRQLVRAAGIPDGLIDVVPSLARVLLGSGFPVGGDGGPITGEHVTQG